jgi:limonene-1,2-epoxide hydrolase
MEIGKQAQEFFDRWSVSHEEMLAAFRDEFAPETVWDQRPFPRITGPDQALKFLGLCHKGMGLETIAVEIKNLAVDGDTVHTERVDTFLRADGSPMASVEVAGVLTYRVGQLVHWREYYDFNTFLVRTIGGMVAGALRKVPGVGREAGRPASS